ncbi:unnamed protein product, partial [Caenorhabditis brenneri]
EDEEEEEEDLDEIAAEESETNQVYESGELETSANLQNTDYGDLLFEENIEEEGEPYSMNLTLNDTRPGSAAMVHTLDNVVDDDDYRNFVFSIQHPQDDDCLQAVYDTEDDAEDEDYNIITDNLNVEDWDETRQDKTTMIPRHEVKALMMDTLLAEKDIPINVFPQDMHREEQRKTQKVRDAEVRERVNEVVTSSSNESCTLLKPGPVTFRPEEIEQLQLQLEQHVQLLTQFVVTCHHDEALCHVRNSAQLMINELDDVRRQRSSESIFNVANLTSAIETCHDINLFPAVDPSLLNYARNPETTEGCILRPEAAAVLARSEAITFPSLLPLCQPHYHQSRTTHFLVQEDIMLALALIQFTHLPRRAEKDIIDRYTVIETHCLPARTALQIRNHLKTMRRQSKNNPIHEIIQAAEQGVCNLSIPQNTWKRTSGAICTWPKVSQPGWYREFQKTFNLTEDRRIHRKNEATMVLTPVKKSYVEYERELCNRVMDPSDDDFVNIGSGPDGRKIIVERNQIDILMRQLIEESKLSPSKRRKNSTPMKLSQMKQHDETSEIQSIANQNSMVPDNTEQPSILSTTLNELVCSEEPSISRASHYSIVPEQSTSSAQPSTSESRKPPVNSPSRTLLDISDYQMSAENLHQYDWDYNSCSSFQIPLTPGRRTPEQFENDDFMDLESNSMMWTTSAYSVVNPMTPRGFAYDNEEIDPIDFSSITGSNFIDEDDYIQFNSFDCQQPMGYSSRMEECSSSSPILEETPMEYFEDRNNCESVADEESSMPGLDMVPPDYEEEEIVENVAYEETYQLEEVVIEEQTKVRGRNIRQTNARPPLKYLKEIEAGLTIPNIKPSRKRTRAEREAMGVVGLDDNSLYEKQKEKVNLKVVEDIRKKLFMHKDTYKKFKRTITNDKLSDIEKISRVILVLANHPDLLNLVLLFAPPEAIISDFDCHSNFQSYKAAMEMLMDIERYITAAKIKEPSLRSLFRFIQNFLEEDPNLEDEQATRKFYQLFGQDRPLWKKLESHFWCLPFKGKPKLENFEYVDLTNVEAMSKRELRDWYNVPPRFETVDDIDQVLMTPYRPSKQDPPSNFVMKCGEMCIKKDDETFIQLEINERLWTRNDDITLLTAYSEAQKAPNFKDSMIPSFVPNLPFGEKSIVARLQYLLAQLKALDE